MNAQLQLTFYRPPRPLPFIPPPSAKLREARDILRRLMLAETALLENVADRLDGIALRLDEMAGKQEMWEMACHPR